jgi:MFS family permease
VDARRMSSTRNRPTTGAYLAVVFLFWMAQYIFVPTLPTYVQTRTDSLAVVGMVLSMYGLWQAVIRLPLGIAADWAGRRKPFILAGMACVGLGAWIMARAGTAEGLALGRAFTGLAAGSWVLLVVAFSALFPPHEAVRASALLTLCNSLGRVLATSLTGFLNDRGGYALAFYAAIVISAAACAVMALIPESRRGPTRPSPRDVGRLVIRRDVLLPSALSAVMQYANWAISFGFLPVLAREHGASDVQISLLTTLYVALMAAGNLAASSATARIGVKRWSYACFIAMAAGILAAALAPSLAWIAVAQAAMGLAQGIGYPVFMGLSIRHVAEEQRATAMGLHQSVYAIGMFAGPALSGVLAQAIGIPAMFGVTACGCLILGALGTRWLVVRAP